MDTTGNNIVFDNPKKTQAVKYYKKYFGNIRQVCKKLDIWRSTFYDWLNKDSVFKEAIDSIQYDKDITDAAEHEAMRRIKGYEYDEVHEIDTDKGHISKRITKRVIATDGLLQFILETKGKDRGYIKRSEITGKDGADLFKDIKITIVDGNKGDKDVS